MKTATLLSLLCAACFAQPFPGGRGGPCSLSGTSTAGFVLTSDGGSTCSWQSAGSASVDANSVKNAIFVVASGTNTITGTTTTAYPGAYATGQVVTFVAANSNSGAVTLNINSLGAKALTKRGNVALVTGNLVAGIAYMAIYDGTQFEVIGYTILAADVPTIPLTSGVSGTLPLANGGTGVTAAQGNGSKVQLSTGSTTTNNCVKFDANGNTVDAGGACGSGGGISGLTPTKLPKSATSTTINDSAVSDDGTTVTSTEPISAPGFTSTDATKSGGLYMTGATSGGAALAVGNVAGTAITYVLPTTNPTTGQVLADNGSVTCPTLPAGFPATCRQMIWSTVTGTGTVTSVATTGPITGGTITTTGTIACATCGVTGTGLNQFASTTSAQLAGVLSDETGTGVSVFATAPTLVTPVLGVATATSINKVALTAPATSATLTLVDGTTATGPAATGTLATLGNAETFSGAKTFTAKVDASGATQFFPKSGTSLPGTCTVGEVYNKTDATAGQNWYFCTATNTWTQQLNSGGSVSGVPVCVSSGASTTAYTCTTSPSFTPATNDLILWKADVNNSTTTPTLAVNGASAGTLLEIDGKSAVVIDEIATGGYMLTVFDGTNWVIRHDSPGKLVMTAPTSALAGTGTSVIKNYTFNANELQGGTSFSFVGSAACTTGVTPGNVAFSIKQGGTGGTSLISCTTGTLGISQTNGLLTVDGKVTYYTVGAAGTARGTITANSNTTLQASGGACYGISTADVTSLNTTAQSTIDLTIAPSQAGTSCTFQTVKITKEVR